MLPTSNQGGCLCCCYCLIGNYHCNDSPAMANYRLVGVKSLTTYVALCVNYTFLSNHATCCDYDAEP